MGVTVVAVLLAGMMFIMFGAGIVLFTYLSKEEKKRHK